MVKNLPAMQETWVWSTGEGNGYPLQDSCPENSLDRGTGQATVRGSQVRQDWVTNTPLSILCHRGCAVHCRVVSTVSASTQSMSTIPSSPSWMIRHISRYYQCPLGGTSLWLRTTALEHCSEWCLEWMVCSGVELGLLLKCTSLQTFACKVGWMDYLAG